MSSTVVIWYHSHWFLKLNRCTWSDLSLDCSCGSSVFCYKEKHFDHVWIQEQTKEFDYVWWLTASVVLGERAVVITSPDRCVTSSSVSLRKPVICVSFPGCTCAWMPLLLLSHMLRPPPLLPPAALPQPWSSGSALSLSFFHSPALFALPPFHFTNFPVMFSTFTVIHTFSPHAHLWLTLATGHKLKLVMSTHELEVLCKGFSLRVSDYK